MDRKNESGREGITVVIGPGVRMTYEGLGGTFASFAYSCVCRKVLPGFHQAGFFKGAELSGTSLALRLSGRRTPDEWKEVLDIALVNIGAVPVTEGRGDYSITIEPVKKGR